jgi:hypothetical protein
LRGHYLGIEFGDIVAAWLDLVSIGNNAHHVDSRREDTTPRINIGPRYPALRRILSR